MPDNLLIRYLKLRASLLTLRPVLAPQIVDFFPRIPQNMLILGGKNSGMAFVYGITEQRFQKNKFLIKIFFKRTVPLGLQGYLIKVAFFIALAVPSMRL